jgi:flagellar protein FliS
MPTSAYQAYATGGVESASPIELVIMLYRGAMESVQEARRAVAAGNIRQRSSAVSKAIEIMSELAASLNHEQGGQVSRNLVELYDYMIRRLIEANASQKEAPLAEVGRLLSGLLEAWTTIASTERLQTQTAAPQTIGAQLAALNSGLATELDQAYRPSFSVTY